MNTSPSIKKLPRWQIVARMKRAGVTQLDIARRVGADQSQVSNTIRRVDKGPVAERIWAEIERAVFGERAV